MHSPANLDPGFALAAVEPAPVAAHPVPAGGDTPEDALAREQQALVAWIELTIATGKALPPETGVAQLLALRHEWARQVAAWVDADGRPVAVASHEIQVELPPQVLERLEALARDGAGTRSGAVARTILASHAGTP